jgi:DNA-binding LytR/AlgR family response regulator
MKAIENQLPAGIFIRVNRSFIVNKNMIQTLKNNSLELLIGEELKEIPIGSSFKDAFLNRIKMINR